MKGALHGAWILAVASASFFADRITKSRFFDAFEGAKETGFSYFGGLVQQMIHKNAGITANFPLPLSVTVVVTLAALGFVVVIMIHSLQDRAYWRVFFLAILLGGALGNLVDRLWLGFVRDWILIGGRSVMNLADFAIILGLLGAYLISRQAPAPIDPRTQQTT